MMRSGGAGVASVAAGAAALLAAALLGCGGSGAADRQAGGGAAGAGPSAGVAALAGCFAGTGLRAGGGAARGGVEMPATLVLDSVVEPGGSRFHARVVGAGRVSAGLWHPASEDSIALAVTGAYPPALYALRRDGNRLFGTGQLASMVPGVEVDTSTWPVSLERTACAPVLRPLEPAGGAAAPFPPALRTELAAMGQADQEDRKGMTAATMGDSAALARLARADSARTERLRAIIRQVGWPTPSRAGEAASEAAFLVLQHSPDAGFQRRMAPVIDSLAHVGEASGQDAALLIDRVLKGQGLPQRYGSQFDMKEGRLVPYPVEDSAGLEARRAAVGLMPMAQYVEMLRAMYRAPAGP